MEGVAEAGRLIISVDDEYGRLKALSSADVILISQGLREASFSTDMLERIFILSPQAETVIQSGSFEISGVARPQSERPLNVQIIAGDGRVLGFGQVYPLRPDGYDYSIFSIQIEAEVSVRQWVQIAVGETSLRVPGDVHYSSFEVVLAPYSFERLLASIFIAVCVCRVPAWAFHIQRVDQSCFRLESYLCPPHPH